MNKYVNKLNRIEFVVTMACTGKCKHCSEGDHDSYTGHIDIAAAINAIEDICQNYNIQSLMTFGGEPLLYPDVVCQIHKTATKMNIPQRDLITNGFFSKDKEHIKQVVKQLANGGVGNILLSVDAFHQETIPLEPVQYFAECVIQSGIPIKLSPAWLVSEQANNPYNIQTRKILNAFSYLNIPIGSGNIIFPQGNALKYLNEYFDENTDFSSPYDEDPKDIRTVSFSENGDVLGGNIYQNNILDIISAYIPK